MNDTTSALHPNIRVSSLSLMGSRKNQQDMMDYQVLDKNIFAAAVCDGMGGLNGGETAAQTACRAFFKGYPRFKQSETVFPGTELDCLAQSLNRCVYGLKKSDGTPLNGGTTIVAAVIENQYLHWLSVGDSRIGRFHNESFSWLNRLHNYKLELDEALSEGVISQEEYTAELPRGEALISYLGDRELKYMDTRYKIPLYPGDIILLCSDGFFNQIPMSELSKILSLLDESMANLTKLTLPYFSGPDPSMDNATAVFIRYL